MGEEQRFIGGMRTYYNRRPAHLFWSPGGNASRPLAELLIDETRIRLRLRHRRLRSAAGVLMPTFEVRLDGARARRYGYGFVARGVFLEGEGEQGDASAIFWCGRRRQQQLLDVLRRRGVAVDQA